MGLILERGRRVLDVLTGLGWAVLAVALCCAVLARLGGWPELAAVAIIGGVLLVLAAIFLLGRTQVEVTVDVQPQRAALGAPVSGAVTVTNRARTPLLPILLELPIGEGAARFRLPTLTPAAAHEELFVVPTERRGVYDVGPATTRRGDPLGLLSNDRVWSEAVEVFVRPRLVALDALGGGLLRDLEGVTTDALSSSDLAFQTLREYTPGDDLRHVHWRSSAKLGTLLVRQYVDTRRSHATVIIDQSPDSYTAPDDFETAVSVAASVAVRASVDEFDVSLVCGEHAAGGEGITVLDACCRVAPGPRPLVEAAGAAAELAPDTSLLLVVTGARAGFEAMQRAAAQFPSEVARYVVQVDPRQRTRRTDSGSVPVLGLQRLDDLPALLHGSVR